jgi:hypothetical protein
MIDLPDHGYVNRRIVAIDPGGAVDGSLGGPSDYINRPGYRYSVQFELPPIPSDKEARIFEALLEQGSRDDVSYPFPLDQKSLSAGIPRINGSNPAGATISIRGLPPGFQFRIGQPFAVIAADGTGFIHKASAAVSVGNTGIASVPVFPLTRTTFTDGLVVEIERPRIRGILQWDGSTQGANGVRPFSFAVSERR